LAREVGYQFMETSALSGTNVEAAFEVRRREEGGRGERVEENPKLQSSVLRIYLLLAVRVH
jgi:hypothetical protein